jgi:hypothetical protein
VAPIRDGTKCPARTTLAVDRRGDDADRQQQGAAQGDRAGSGGDGEIILAAARHRRDGLRCAVAA